MSRARILILSSAHLCRNPRVLKEATTLGAAGYDVTVLSISTHARFEHMDQALMRGRPFQRITLQCRVDKSGSRFAGFFQRSATWSARQLCQWFGFETAQCLGPASALLRRARSVPADLTILHTEIPLWAARYLAADGRRIAVDLEDWHSRDLLERDLRGRPLRLLRRAEAFALQHAAYTSVPSQCMADALRDAHGFASPRVIHNAFPLQPVSRPDRPATTGAPHFIWFSQTIGPGRGLEHFFAAWARTRHPSHVHLLGDPNPGYLKKLLAPLPEEKRRDVHFVPFVSHHDLPSKLAEYDLGLALETQHPANRDLAITNKILQYLNAGLAVVATDTAGQQEVMRHAPDCGVLVTPRETADFTKKLDELLGDPVRLRSAQLAARAAAVRHFCWEREEPVLLAAVKLALT